MIVLQVLILPREISAEGDEDIGGLPLLQSPHRFLQVDHTSP